MSDQVTLASPPTTAETAALMLSYATGQSGVITDANIGSQVRTLSEAFGQVAELEAVMSFALVLQGAIYGAMAAVNIFPLPATQAQGTLVFSTGSISPPPATQNVVIAA